MADQDQTQKLPVQSGMEQQHERWVLATLNFLAGLDIPFYLRDDRGDRIPGRDLDIPARLALVREKVVSLRLLASQELRASVAAMTRLDDIERSMRAACELLEASANRGPGVPEAKQALELFSNYLEPKNQPNDNPTADHKGVKRYRFDVRDVMVRLGLNNLAHDVGPNERLCPSCWGLGLVKSNSPYGLGKMQLGERAFPYRHEWLMACPTCYLGKVGVCEHCSNVLVRGQLRCKCDAAVAVEAAMKLKANDDRRAKCKRIKLADYTGELLWCESSDRYVAPDSVDDVLVDEPDEVFYACNPIRPSAFYPDADDLITQMEEQAYDEAHPDDDDHEILDYSKEAVVELAKLIETWGEKNLKVKQFWYPDMNTIVEVSSAE